MNTAIASPLSVPRAVLVAAYTGDESWRPEASLGELERLAGTAGVQVVGRVIQRARTHQPRSYIGKGRVRALKEEKSSLAFNAIITDDELSPEQHRYLEDVLDVDVLDRTAVILHIFAQHARSREGQLQVELAQYRYLLPRLTGRGIELSRMGAASRGGTGVNVRGPGETKLETDRRRIRRRISELNREIEAVRSQRAQSRRERRLSGIPVIALAGYTNAGKSTLLNALTGAGVLSSDQLFATLDPTTRRVQLPGGQEILLTDTVGFIQKLPSDLVAAFRATLEEIVEADLILHVVDASHPQVEEQAEAVEDELEDLGVVGRPRLTILNKADLVPPERIDRLSAELDAAVAVSALKGEGMQQLEAAIAHAIAAAFVPVEVQIPYAAASLVGLFRTRGMVDAEQHDAGGTHITGRLPAALLPSFRPYFS